MIQYYAGIGSRQTLKPILFLFRNVAKYLALKDYCLRSGSAQGADHAFEVGCDEVGGKKEIFLPWLGFENSDSKLVVSNQEAFNIAAKYHPYWMSLKPGAQKLQARNSHQVLGLDLKTPSKFVICWTKNGTGSGGTGQALRIAKAYNIPIFDAGLFYNPEQCEDALYDFIEVHI